MTSFDFFFVLEREAQLILAEFPGRSGNSEILTTIARLTWFGKICFMFLLALAGWVGQRDWCQKEKSFFVCYQETCWNSGALKSTLKELQLVIVFMQRLVFQR